MSVDVARKGEDRTVISLWQGLELDRIELRTKQGTDVTEQQIKDLAAEERIADRTRIIIGLMASIGILVLLILKVKGLV
jgi:hypothetical protein